MSFPNTISTALMDIELEKLLDRHYDPYSGELLGGNDEYDDEFNQWML